MTSKPTLLGKSRTCRVYAVDDKSVRKEIKITSSSHGIPFLLELELLHTINHPHLLTGLGVNISHNLLNVYLARAKYDLTDIKDSFDVSLRFFYEISLAVLSLHQQDIAHLDIKPDNILIFDEDNIPVAKLGDLGHAHYLPKPLRSNLYLGTMTYLPPEIIQAIRYEWAVVYSKTQDIWSLGLTFFLILTSFTDYDMVDGYLATPYQLERKARNYFYGGSNGFIIEERLANCNLDTKRKEILVDLFKHLLIEESSRWSIQEVVATLEKIIIPLNTNKTPIIFIEATWPAIYQETIDRYLSYFPNDAQHIICWLKRLSRLDLTDLQPDEVVPVLVYMCRRYLGVNQTILSFLTKTLSVITPKSFLIIQDLIITRLYPCRILS